MIDAVYIELRRRRADFVVARRLAALRLAVEPLPARREAEPDDLRGRPIGARYPHGGEQRKGRMRAPGVAQERLQRLIRNKARAATAPVQHRFGQFVIPKHTRITDWEFPGEGE